MPYSKKSKEPYVTPRQLNSKEKQKVINTLSPNTQQKVNEIPYTDLEKNTANKLDRAERNYIRQTKNTNGSLFNTRSIESTRSLIN